MKTALLMVTLAAAVSFAACSKKEETTTTTTTPPATTTPSTTTIASRRHRRVGGCGLRDVGRLVGDRSRHLREHGRFGRGWAPRPSKKFARTAKSRLRAAFCLGAPSMGAIFGVRVPAELATARQAKRNCVRVTERGKEAWSVNREPRYTNRIRGGAGQGEQAKDCKALVAKGQAT